VPSTSGRPAMAGFMRSMVSTGCAPAEPEVSSWAAPSRTAEVYRVEMFLSLRQAESVRGDGEHRRRGLLAGIRQRHQDQEEREDPLGPEIAVLDPVPVIPVANRREGIVRAERPAEDP